MSWWGYSRKYQDVFSVPRYLGWTNVRVLIAKVEVKRDM